MRRHCHAKGEDGQDLIVDEVEVRLKSPDANGSDYIIEGTISCAFSEETIEDKRRALIKLGIEYGFVRPVLEVNVVWVYL